MTPAIPFPGRDVREPRTCPHRTCPQMLIAAAFKIAKKWKLFKDRLFSRAAEIYTLLSPARAMQRPTPQVHASSHSRLLTKAPEQCVGDHIELSYFSPSSIFSPLGPGIGDGILRWDHIPKSITSQDNILVLLGVKSVDACVWFR